MRLLQRDVTIVFCNLFWNLVDLTITAIIQPITRGIKNCRDRGYSRLVARLNFCVT